MQAIQSGAVAVARLADIGTLKVIDNLLTQGVPKRVPLSVEDSESLEKRRSILIKRITGVEV